MPRTDLKNADIDLTRKFADHVNTFMSENKVTPQIANGLLVCALVWAHFSNADPAVYSDDHLKSFFNRALDQYRKDYEGMKN